MEIFKDTPVGGLAERIQKAAAFSSGATVPAYGIRWNPFAPRRQDLLGEGGRTHRHGIRPMVAIAAVVSTSVRA